jgi:hypothetical protein
MSDKPQPREKQQSGEKDRPPYEPPSVEEIETELISTAPGSGPPPVPPGAA